MRQTNDYQQSFSNGKPNIAPFIGNLLLLIVENGNLQIKTCI